MVKTMNEIDNFLCTLLVLPLCALLVVVISCGIVQISFSNIEWIVIGILTLVIAEVIFWFLFHKKPDKGTSVFWFTARWKLLWLFISFPISGIFVIISRWVRLWIPVIVDHWKTISMTVLGVVVVMVGLWVFVWTNSLKYRKNEQIIKRRRK